VLNLLTDDGDGLLCQPCRLHLQHHFIDSTVCLITGTTQGLTLLQTHHLVIYDTVGVARWMESSPQWTQLQ